MKPPIAIFWLDATMLNRDTSKRQLNALRNQQTSEDSMLAIAITTLEFYINFKDNYYLPYKFYRKLIN